MPAQFNSLIAPLPFRPISGGYLPMPAKPLMAAYFLLFIALIPPLTGAMRTIPNPSHHHRLSGGQHRVTAASPTRTAVGPNTSGYRGSQPDAITSPPPRTRSRKTGANSRTTTILRIGLWIGGPSAAIFCACVTYCFLTEEQRERIYFNCICCNNMH